MATFDNNAGAPGLHAFALYSGWLREPAGTRPPFDVFCAGHTLLRKELSDLHAFARLVQSASFQHSLKGVFGENAEVQLTLDDAALEETQETLPDRPNQHSKQNASDLQTSARYSVEREVARGGMGIIYKVRDRELNRILAMKVMIGGGDRSSAPADTLLTRFFEEVQVTAQLDHPGIVAVHELGVDATGRPYFTMKLVKGRDLSRIFELARAEEEGWNVPRAVGALIKACQAIAFAHTKGVLHRDVKPANVMVGRFGEVYVMDWGLAKVMGRKDLHDLRLSPASPVTVTEIKTLRATTGSTADSPLITMDGSVVGTPAYMSPEQARGQVEQIDTQSDIYSLGAILYNLLTGQAPYVEPGARISPHTIVGMVIQGPPKRVHTINSQASPELVAICEKAMAREKGDRYASGLDLAEDLQAHLDNRVVKAYRTGAVAELRSWVSRNRALASALSGAVLLAIVGVSIFIRQQDLAKEQLRENLYIADMNVAHQAILNSHFSRAVELVDKYGPPEAGETELRGFEWRYLWQQKQGNHLRSFIGHSNLVACIAFSPDSELLASIGWGHDEIEIRHVASGQVVTNLGKLTSWIWRNGLAFSPDGKILAVAENRQRVLLYDTLTWRQMPSLDHSFNTNWAPYSNPIAWSSDGRTLAAVGAGELVFWNARDWTQRTTTVYTNLPGFGIFFAYSPDGTRLVTASYEQLQVWDPETGELKAHSEKFSPSSIAFSPDGHWLAAGAEDGSVRLWDSTDIWKRPVRFAADSSTLLSMTFSTDNKTLVTGGMDQVLRGWDVATQRQTHRFQGQSGQTWSLARSPDGRLMAGGTQDGSVLLWDLHSTLEKAETGEALRPLAFSEDNNHLLIVDTNMSFQYIGLAAEHSVKAVRLPLADHSAPSKVVSANSKNAALLISTNRIEIREFESGSLRLSLTNQTGSFLDRILLSADNQLIVVGPRTSVAGAAFPARVEVWQIASAQRVATFESFNFWAISPDSRMVAGERALGRVEVVNFVTEERWVSAPGHRGNLTAAAFSPNGKLVVSTSLDSDARLWKVGTDQPSRVLKGHKTEVHCVTFSPDGKTIVTGDGVGDVKFWSVATAKELLSISMPGKTVRRALFSPDSRTLVFEMTHETGIDRRGNHLYSSDSRVLALHHSFHLITVPILAEIDAADRARFSLLFDN